MPKLTHAVDAGVARLQYRAPNVRCEALRALLRVAAQADEGVINALFACLEDEDAMVQDCALSASSEVTSNTARFVQSC